LLLRPRLDGPARDRLKSIIKKMQAMDASGLTKYPGIVQYTRALSAEETQQITALAAKVACTMREVANGLHDTYVTNVFGVGHKDDAKKVFEGAADALERLTPSFWSSSGIVVDEMRKQEVWCSAALTSSTRIALSQSTVEAAANHDMGGKAFLTLVHESTHALEKGPTKDVFYENHEGFLTAGPQSKLSSADYYKEVVRQIATGKGRIFVEGDVNPHLGDKRSPELRLAATTADKVLNAAWISAIRIHDKIDQMARNPGNFVGWETWLRNASRLMGITLHREEQLAFKWNALSASTGPKITTGDLAVIDNKIAMLAKCNGKAASVMVEPTRCLSAEGFVEHVLEQVVKSCWTGFGLKFSKSIEKDVIIIRSLAELNDGFNARQKSGTKDPSGLAELPEPMKSYDARVRAI
jgi:hypothetical protein